MQHKWPTRHQRTRLPWPGLPSVGRGIEIALKEFKEPVGPSVCQRAAFVSAAVRGGWVGAYAVESPARAEIDALAKRVKRAA